MYLKKKYSEKKILPTSLKQRARKPVIMDFFFKLMENFEIVQHDLYYQEKLKINYGCQIGRKICLFFFF